METKADCFQQNRPISAGRHCQLEIEIAGLPMFLSSKNYLKQFRYMVEGSTNLSLAVAFWGQGAETLIAKAWKGQTLRILCNLGSGGTNPQVIRELIELAEKKPSLKILTLDDLHAKVAVIRDVIVEAFGQQGALALMCTLNKTLHGAIPAMKSSEIIARVRESVFTQSGPIAAGQSHQKSARSSRSRFRSCDQLSAICLECCVA